MQRDKKIGKAQKEPGKRIDAANEEEIFIPLGDFGLDDNDDDDDFEFMSSGIARAFNRRNGRLAASLLEKLLAAHKEKNLVFSPFGVAALLQMLQYGVTSGSSVDDTIEKLLDDFDASSFRNVNTPDTIIEQANGLWFDKSLGNVKEEFRETMEIIFHTEPQNVDFCQTEKVKAMINKWASENTHGLIKKLDLNLAPSTFLVLANALYFKAKWEIPFESDNTRKRVFHNADGSDPKVWTMRLETEYADFARTRDYEMARLRYLDDCSMTIILPRKGKDLDAVMCGMDWRNANAEINVMLDLRLPKFNQTSKLELKDALSELGLAELFDGEEALSRITDEPAFVGNIMQQCTVSVDEEGTEAAAVTYAETIRSCLLDEFKPKKRRMVVERPFGFAIEDPLGTLLFMGVVNHLEAAETAAPAPDDDELNDGEG